MFLITNNFYINFSTKRVVSALPNKKTKKCKTNEKEKNEETKRRLPLSVNAAILLLFCMLGGWVYMAADGSGHTFIEANL